MQVVSLKQAAVEQRALEQKALERSGNGTCVGHASQLDQRGAGRVVRDRRAARRVATNRKAAFLLAASFAAGSDAVLAQQVERDDVAVPPAPPAAAAAPAAPAAPAGGPKSAAEKSKSDKERDARLKDAQKRLEAAASEVAALSSEIATEAMQGFNDIWSGAGPRRVTIGTQLQSAESGGGAIVRDVSPGGPAEAAGIRAGDVIVAVNGKTLSKGAREIVQILRDVEPDSTVQIRATREGKVKEFKVIARKLEGRAFAWTPPDPNMNFNFDFDPDSVWGAGRVVSRGLSGMEVTTLTPQLARYFGADEGLLVLRAPKGEMYKLQDGDVILNIDGRVPTNGSHVSRILRSYQPGEKLTLRIMRDRKPMDLQVTLPENEDRVRRTRVRPIEGGATPL